MTEILAFGNRRDNAQLMADCATLGYLPEPVLDMTYGQGRFWLKHEPDDMITNDLDPYTNADTHDDFSKMPYIDGRFRSVVFDPPYKLNGTGGSHPSDAGYGVADTKTVAERQRLIQAGLLEGARLTSRFLLVKCQDQVVSGRKTWQTLQITAYVAGVGLPLVDMLHVQSYRAQPTGRRQLHSRGDYSTLLVFEKRGNK